VSGSKRCRHPPPRILRLHPADRALPGAPPTAWPVDFTRWARPKLGAYAGLSGFGLLAALVVARPEIVALTAPFVLALAAGLALGGRPQLEARLETERSRVLEGDTVVARLELTAATSIDRLELYLRLPDGIDMARDGDVHLHHARNPTTVRLARGRQRVVELKLGARRWGGHVLGPVYVRARDPLGLVSWDGTCELREPLRVYPREEQLQRLLAPRETQVSAGNEVSRRRGEGIEFADIRPFVPGDLVRRVNWRASARRSELWVNEAHPERNVDVILFLDSFAEARLGSEGTLDLAVRATASLADAYIQRRDRVGLISFGGILRWLLPGMGTLQRYRIVDALLDTEVVLSYYWRNIDVIPPRTLPPSALVVALTPLLDERSVGALLDLRARGFDLAVVDVSPVPFARPRGTRLDELAYRIWRLRRDALRNRFARAGVAVAEWQHRDDLQVILEEVRRFRRYARHARI
jgi:uncharacterized protein (DUF58 family)